MKWRTGPLAVAVCACALGCRAETSSEGKILQVVLVRCPWKDAPPHARQEAENAFRSIPSKMPIMERFEWGRIQDDGGSTSHVLLVTFHDPQSAFDRAYSKALHEAAGEQLRVGTFQYLVHDATPDVRTTTHGHLRRVDLIWLERNTTLKEMQKLEDAMAALPKHIPAIERLEWGTRIGYDPAKPKPIDPAHRDPHLSAFYCLLLTFNSPRARDACLSDPAFKEFQRLLEQYESQGRNGNELEYAAHVEYVAR